MWDSVDRAIVLAHLENEGARCPGCGSYLDETSTGQHAYKFHRLLCGHCNARAEYAKTDDAKHAPAGTQVLAERLDLAALGQQ